MTTNEQILLGLEALYPDAKAELNFSNPFETLIATILAAQCTDKKVNTVTPKLFADFPGPAQMAELSCDELIPYIKTCGLYHAKSKNIIAACKMIMEQYGGEVPSTLPELMSLPGVGRKTANVVYSNAFGGDAIAVDTHVFRTSNRLGLANSKNVLQTELQLQEAIPKARWSIAHHWLILHGRRVCKAQRPLCASCSLAPHCKDYLARHTSKEIAPDA